MSNEPIINQIAAMIEESNDCFRNDVADALSDFFGTRIEPSRVDALQALLQARGLEIVGIDSDEDE